MESVTRPQLTAEVPSTYLIVSLGDALYGINSLAVEEVVLLPELTPLAEAPRDVVGVVNLRGAILPAIDLHLRLGYQPLPYRITDSIVVLAWQGQRLGLIVNRVRGVQELEPMAIEQLAYGSANTGNLATLSQGLARGDDEIIVLLSPEALVGAGEVAARQVTLEEVEAEAGLAAQRRFFPEATPAEREILRARAASLRPATESLDTEDFWPLAVLQLGTEVFAMDLRLVREFAELTAMTPIPCCPPHIAGNMNLRGEIVTLIDITAWLRLPPLASATKAAIVQVDGLAAGVLVDEVLDVLLLDPAQIGNVPTALHAIDDEYLQGAAPYGDRLMSLLDLAKLLRQGGLVVDETV